MDDFLSKDVLLTKYAEERKALLRKLNQALESEKQAYERLADLDVTRHVEVADLKGEVAGLKSEIKGIREGEGLSVKTIEKLRRESEVKRLQLKESEDNLLRTAASLRELEARYSAIEEALKAAEAERDKLKDMASQALEVPEGEAAALKAEIESKSGEIASLKENLSGLKALLGEKEKEAESLRLKHEEEVGRLSYGLRRTTEEIDLLKSAAEAHSKEDASHKGGEDVEHIKAGYSEEIDRLVSVITRREEEIKALRAELDRQGSKSYELKQEVFRLDQALTQIKEQGEREESGLETEAALDALLKPIREENESLRERLSEVEREKEILAIKKDAAISGYEDELSLLKGEALALRAELENWEGALRTKEEEIRALDARHQAEIRGFVSEVGKLLTENAGLEKAMSLYEAVEALKSQHKSQVEGFAAETATQRREKAELENALLKLKEQKERELAEYLASLNRLAGTKDELSFKLAAADETVASLKEEKAELTNRLSQIAAEIDKLRADRAGEINAMGEHLGAVTEKITDVLVKLQSGIADNLERLENLSLKQAEFYYPAVIMEEKKPPGKRKAPLLKIAFAGLATAVVAFGLYAAKGRFDERLTKAQNTSESPALKVAPQETIAAPWSGTREVVYGNFKATLTFLTPAIMEDFGVSDKLTDAEKQKYYVYALDLRADGSIIPEEVVNSPLSAISFIDAKDNRHTPAEIPDLEGSKKAIYRVHSGKVGAALFRCYIAAEKTLQLRGMEIKGLSKGPIVITKH